MAYRGGQLPEEDRRLRELAQAGQQEMERRQRAVAPAVRSTRDRTRMRNLSTFARYGLPIAGVVAMAGAAIPVVVVGSGLASVPILLVSLVLCVGALIAAAAVLLISRNAGRNAVAAERRWIDSQPFPLVGWWESLDSLTTTAHGMRNVDGSFRKDEDRRLDLTLVFGGERPPEDLVYQVLVGAAPELRVQDGSSREHSLEVSLRFPPTLGNAKLHSTVHRLVDQGLVTLHTRYPLASVRVQTSFLT